MLYDCWVWAKSINTSTAVLYQIILNKSLALVINICTNQITQFCLIVASIIVIKHSYPSIIRLSNCFFNRSEPCSRIVSSQVLTWTRTQVGFTQRNSGPKQNFVNDWYRPSARCRRNRWGDSLPSGTAIYITRYDLPPDLGGSVRHPINTPPQPLEYFRPVSVAERVTDLAALFQEFYGPLDSWPATLRASRSTTFFTSLAPVTAWEFTLQILILNIFDLYLL